MPTTNTRNLTLTQVGSDVTVNVTYKAVFSPLERILAANGVTFTERIQVMGVDPSGSTTGNILHNFAVQNLPVTLGTVEQTIQRNRSIIVSRASLDEDSPAPPTDPLGSDEIRCRIEIDLIGLPAGITDCTNQEVLGALI